MEGKIVLNGSSRLLRLPALFFSVLLLCQGCGGGGGGGGNRDGDNESVVETVELKDAATSAEEAFLSGDPTLVLQLMTDEAKEAHESTLTTYQEQMTKFGEDFKTRELITATSNYAEYKFSADDKDFTVAFSRQEDGAWKLMRF